jgi:hypothetical protein
MFLDVAFSRQQMLQQYYSRGLLASQGVKVDPLPPHVYATSDGPRNGSSRTGKCFSFGGAANIRIFRTK